LYSERKDSLVLAVITFLISFFIGFFTLYFFGFSLTTSLIVGVAMSITAEATRAKVLIDLRVLKTRVGSALMGAGILDDLFGIVIFTSIMLFLSKGSFYNSFLLGGVILSFFLGIVFQKYLGIKHICSITLQKMMGWLIIPFFFISIGLNFNFDSLIFNPVLLSGIVFLGFFSKFIGSFASKRFINFSWKQVYLISWAMSSRGSIELALALLALRASLISQEIYSSLIIMALVTTLLFPFVIIRMVKKNKKIMD